MMDLIGLPLTSIVLFVLAGILIGHSLWYRDRSADIEKMKWLEKRYLQAREVARRRRQEQRNLAKTRDQQLFELGTLRQRHEAKLVEFKQLERSSQSTTAELDSLRTHHHDVSDQLAAEQRRNERLVSQLQEVLQAKTKLETELARQTESLVRASEELGNDETGLRRTVADLRKELDHSQDSLKRAAQDLDARSQDLDVIRTERDALEQDLDVTHHRASQLATSFSEQEIKLTNVREQLEELLPLRSESVEASLRIAEQRLQLAEREQEVQKLRLQTSGEEAEQRETDQAQGFPHDALEQRRAA